jgi:hypothetical protein
MVHVVADTLFAREDSSASRIARPWLLERFGRGRAGGSTFLDFLIQWARRSSRRVKPLDGDLRSRTLSRWYPAVEMDGASAPQSDDLDVILRWFGGELDAMPADGVCRVVDFGGGDRILQEYGHEMKVGAFCDRFGLGLVWAAILGPDPEDLAHVLQIIRSGAVTNGKMLVVLNEGVIRGRQSVAGLFDRTKRDSEFLRLLHDGAKLVVMPRLTCMEQMRERGLTFYAAAAGEPDPDGRPTPPTIEHMVGEWVQSMEEQMVDSGAAQWLI